MGKCRLTLSTSEVFVRDEWDSNSFSSVVVSFKLIATSLDVLVVIFVHDAQSDRRAVGRVSTRQFECVVRDSHC